MFETIPAAWRRVPLSSLGQRVRRRNTTGNTNVLTISAVHGLVNQKEFFNKIVASENLSNYFLLKSGEFAYNKSYSNGYPVGVVRRLKRYQSGILSPLYICFDMSSSEVDERYAELFFDSQWFIDEINQIAKEGARNHGLLNVGVGEFFDLEFVLPPLPEQQKIAAILSSVDDVIETTRAQIDKLKDLKTGMMQELLTKGIGHTEFKDSPLGRIPEAWAVLPLSELVSRDRPITYGIVQTGENLPNGIPCVRVVDLMRPALSTRDMIRTSKKISHQYKRTLLQEGDIMFALRGEIGHVRLTDESLVGANLTRGVALISPNNAIMPRYLLWALRSPVVRSIIMDGVNGSALQEIPLGNLRNVLIPVPPEEEQARLADTLDALEQSKTQSERKLDTYRNLKKALMQDLLTGKVRVKVDQKESAVA